MPMIENFSKEWLKYASMKVALFWTAFVAWIMADNANRDTVIGLLPVDLQPLGGPLLAFAVFASHFAARGAVQPKLAKT